MSLPVRTTFDDLVQICTYFSTKAAGATPREAAAVLDARLLDSRKTSALKFWGLIEEEEDRLKLTEPGRRVAKGESYRNAALLEIIRKIPAYNTIVERAAHKSENEISALDVAANWHDYFKGVVSDNNETLKEQAICFFQLALGAGLGTLIVGRKGSSTRFQFEKSNLLAYISQPSNIATTSIPATEEEILPDPSSSPISEAVSRASYLGQGIFIAHGKNKKPLEQLKHILDQFKVAYKVAVEEPNLGRPISAKVRATMEACNCAILIFTADEEFNDKDGHAVWRPSENVIYELGAASYLYENRVVIMKEEDVKFPSNFQDIGYISFVKDQLEAKAMEIIKELVGFDILKITT
jgi:hypothetical protein